MPKTIKKRTVKPATQEERAKNAFYSIKEIVTEKERTVVPVVIAVVVLIALASGFFIYKSNMKKKAESLTYEAYKEYYSLYQPNTAQEANRYKNALEKFRKSYEAVKSPFALFYMSNCYLGMGSYDDALKALDELNKTFPDDEKFVPLSYFKMAVINLRKDNKEAALKNLDSLYNHKSPSLKDLALIESAKILETMGKNEESAKKYDEITKSFPNSPYAEEARSRTGAKKG